MNWLMIPVFSIGVVIGYAISEWIFDRKRDRYWRREAKKQHTIMANQLLGYDREATGRQVPDAGDNSEPG